MEVKIYETITDIGEKEWDAIVGYNRLICRHKYLEAVEKSRINDTRYYYPVVYENGEIIAHACVYYISTELDAFAKGFLKKVINAVRKIWKNFLILRSLECGTPVAIGNTISFKEGVDKRAILKLLTREIEDLARKIKIKVILFRDFYDDELSLFDDLRKIGYTKVYNLPNAKLEIRWGSFEEYLSSMRNNYRKKIIKQKKRCYKEGISVKVLKNFSEYSEELEKLWANAYSNAKEYRREILTSLFFRNINTYLWDCSAIILMEKEGVPIAFSLLLFDNDTLIPLFCGLDYGYNEKYRLYFNILYKVVEVGINKGMREVDMGITTLDPKKDLGTIVFPLTMYMKHTGLFFNKIVPKIFSMMTPQQKIGPRNVFKDDKSKSNKDNIDTKVKLYHQPIYQ